MQYKIKDLPKVDQPREKLASRGEKALLDSELLAILLGSGYQGKNVKKLAQSILRRFNLKNLTDLSFKALRQIKGIGPAKACQIKASFELGRRAFSQENNLPLVNRPKKAIAQVENIKSSKKENFCVLYLNAREQLVFKDIISIGPTNMSLVHPREVFQPALEHFASAIILIHNHPSGNIEPTDQDILLTQDLIKAGKLLGIEIIDHLIISGEKFLSMRQEKIIF